MSDHGVVTDRDTKDEIKRRWENYIINEQLPASHTALLGQCLQDIQLLIKLTDKPKKTKKK
jgi:hypothetical protein